MFMGKAVNLMKSGKASGAKNVENSAPSTGKGGIENSLKVKAAGTKNSPQIEKNVNQF